MNVYYSRYKLIPLKSANRLSSSSEKWGIHLKIKKRRSANFADYFPHIPLGDMECDEFLEKFKYQDHEYHQKVFHFLLNDDRLSALPNKRFFNHEIWDGLNEPHSHVIKYKLKDESDLSFLKLFEKKISVRLDANALFTRKTLQNFLKEVPDFSLLEYLEDPISETDWSNFSLPLARDFIDGTPFSVLIHKPNSRFLKEEGKPVIFSSYMGSDLGKWHAYCELKEKGSFKFHHGIITTGYYQEERLKFDGNFQQGFVPNEKTLKIIYNELDAKEWKLLCSI